jgi:GTP 3',8-cyclase
MTPDAPHDRFRRPLRSLRISVTDRCNLRCGYCMPERDYTWLAREDILSFEEIDRLVGAFAGLGVDSLRLTGGEPLIRRDLPELVGLLARHRGIGDLAMTTNGILLREHGAALRAAGLRRLTVSLDSLDRERYRTLAGRDELDAALAGVDHAVGLGFESVKINTVVMRGENDDEIPGLIEFGRTAGVEVRFIEYMDVGGATGWRRDLVFARDDILASVAARFGAVTPVADAGSAPARRWRLSDGTEFGIIASTTAPFCGTCDRARLTADGVWYRCLYARQGIDLRERLRAGDSIDALRDRIHAAWRDRTDRGAEDRLALTRRGAMATKPELDVDPHLEMHTRGG